jgi:hypothetical protein
VNGEINRERAVVNEINPFSGASWQRGEKRNETSQERERERELNESVRQLNRKISIIDFSSFIFICPPSTCHGSSSPSRFSFLGADTTEEDQGNDVIMGPL